MATTNRTRVRRRGRAALVVASVLVTAAALAGWGRSSPPSGEALVVAPIHNGGIQAPATTPTIQVRGGEFFFRLSAKSVAKRGKVTFVLRNVGHLQQRAG